MKAKLILSCSWVIILLSSIFLLLYYLSHASLSKANNANSHFCVKDQLFLPVIYSRYYPGTSENEPNNNSLQANGPLTPNLAYYGTITDPKDYYSVYLTNSGNLTIDLEGAMNNTNEDLHEQGTQLLLYYTSQKIRLVTTRDLVSIVSTVPYDINYANAPLGWYFVYIFVPGNYDKETNYTLTVYYPSPTTPSITPIYPCTPTPTSTPTSITTTELLCPTVSAGFGSHLIIFNGEKIFSNSTIDDAKTNVVNIDIPSGEYHVYLASHDSHSLHPSQNQTDESWFLLLYDEGGGTVATSGPSGDLPEDTDCATTNVGDLHLSANVHSAVGFHAAYPMATTESPNSIAPVYAILEPVETIVSSNVSGTPLPPYHNSTPTPTPHN